MIAVMLFSLVSLVVFTVTAVLLITRKRNVKLSNSVFIPLLICLLLYDFIVISNFLEHALITSYFDPLEDIAEIVFTLLFLFFVNNWRKDRSETRFRELFQLSPIPLAEVDTDWNIVRMNDILVYKFHEFFGNSIDNVKTISQWWDIAYPDPEYRQKVNDEWLKTVELVRKNGGPVQSAEREFTSRDGTKRIIIVTTSKIADNLLISLIDITDLKQAEADREKLQKQLLQAQKMEAIGILAGGVAHDFNNILSTIMGYTELTLELMKSDDPYRKNLTKILDATHRSTDLVRQLLTFARKQSVSPVPIELNKVVQTTLGMLKRLIGEDIELIWLPAKVPCTVKMDPSQLDQILTNLCVNARDAIDNVGKITIKIDIVDLDENDSRLYMDCSPGPYVLLSIMDNGKGMDKITAQHIFEPFYTTKDVGKGTGLGLATVYGIVQQIEGFINLYSEPNKGTTFNIYLPSLNEKSTAINLQEVPEIPYGNAETILLVEDDPALLQMSQVILERLGYLVITATSPGDALAMIGSNHNNIQMVLTDVVMPEMNGRELIDKMLEVRPDIKYLFMSGYTADVVINRGVSEASEHFIQKPFTFKDIALKVREVLDVEK